MSSKIMYKKPLGVGQVAAVCRVSKKTVLNWIYEGALKAFTTYGGHYRVWPVNLKKFLETSGMDIPFDYVDETETHILIIDDEKPYAQMLKSVISAEIPNAHITTTDNGYEGLLLIGEMKPHLIILDVRMPGLDGFQVLELLRNRKAEHKMKILVISNLANPETKEQLAKTCADAVLEEQSDISLLVKAVGALIRSEGPVLQEELTR
jgi:excisionase family DNA binding protein